MPGLWLSGLVARWVGIVSATGRIICSGSRSTDDSSADAYRNPTGYGCPTIDATTVNTAMIDANATNSYASSIGEGVSRNGGNTGDADNHGCRK